MRNININYYYYYYYCFLIKKGIIFRDLPTTVKFRNCTVLQTQPTYLTTYLRTLNWLDQLSFAMSNFDIHNNMDISREKAIFQNENIYLSKHALTKFIQLKRSVSQKGGPVTSA